MSEIAATAHEGIRMLSGYELVAALFIVALPFIASLLVFVSGKRMWKGGASMAITSLVGSLILSGWFFIKMLQGHEAFQATWSTNWFTIGEYNFEFGIYLDNLSIWLATLVSLLSLLIFIFSTKYMSEEKNVQLRRYYAVKALFVGGMLGTVLMDNYLMMFMFWEIMGLCSYLLIGFWFHKPSAASAAKKAFLVTRLGDILLMVGLIFMFIEFKTMSYREIFFETDLAAHKDSLLMIGLLIFGGAVGKSAQFPLDLWLPDAMEGPTTVSALIHAATMVKAGVYLVARTFPILLVNPDSFMIIGLVGGVTAIYTASMALVALDIKRVLAFSTLSQLGYMFLALGAGGIVYLESGSGVGFTAALLHLMNHAFFKALLFLGAASVIMGMHHHQDMRDMGGLRKRMPVTFVTMLVGSLSIAGIIPLSGFWSKDEVLATAFKAGQSDPLFFVLWVMGLITAGLTAFYMFRMMMLTFFGKERTSHAEHAHESSKAMTIPLLILAVFAAISGLWLVTGLGGGFEAVITYPFAPQLGEAHHVAPGEIFHEIMVNPLTYLSLAIATIGILFAVRKYRNGLPKSEELEPTRGLRAILYNRYYVTKMLYEPLGAIGAVGIAKISQIIDRKAIDGSVNGVGAMTVRKGEWARQWQNGRISTYLASIAIGVTILLVILYEVVLRVRW